MVYVARESDFDNFILWVWDDKGSGFIAKGKYFTDKNQ